MHRHGLLLQASHQYPVKGPVASLLRSAFVARSLLVVDCGVGGAGRLSCCWVMCCITARVGREVPSPDRRLILGRCT